MGVYWCLLHSEKLIHKLHRGNIDENEQTGKVQKERQSLHQKIHTNYKHSPWFHRIEGCVLWGSQYSTMCFRDFITMDWTWISIYLRLRDWKTQWELTRTFSCKFCSPGGHFISWLSLSHCPNHIMKAGTSLHPTGSLLSIISKSLYLYSEFSPLSDTWSLK